MPTKFIRADFYIPSVYRRYVYNLNLTFEDFLLECYIDGKNETDAAEANWNGAILHWRKKLRIQTNKQQILEKLKHG